MNKLFKKVESIILTLSMTGLVFLICIQFMNIKNEDTISVTKFNNEIKYIPLDSFKEFDSGVLILKLMDIEHKDISILINGEIIEDFSKEDEVKINVSNNDLIEIDGTKYMEKITVKLIGVSKNIENPNLNRIVSTSQSIEILGKVRLK